MGTSYIASRAMEYLFVSHRHWDENVGAVWCQTREQKFSHFLILPTSHSDSMRAFTSSVSFHPEVREKHQEQSSSREIVWRMRIQCNPGFTKGFSHTNSPQLKCVVEEDNAFGGEKFNYILLWVLSSCSLNVPIEWATTDGREFPRWWSFCIKKAFTD